MDLHGVGRDLSASLSLLHNVGWIDAWCRQRCGAGGTRPCHVLMVKAMVTVDRRCCLEETILGRIDIAESVELPKKVHVLMD